MIEKVINVYSSNNILLAQLTQEDLTEVVIENRQNGESLLTFNIDCDNSKYKEISGMGNVFIADNRAYTETLTDECVNINHLKDGTKQATFNLVERHYSLRYNYVTAYNSTTGYSSIDTHMVVILSGGTSPLIVNGTTITPSYPKGSAGYALTALLHGSGWSVGTVDVIGTYDLETDKKTIYENIKEVIQLWGGILIIDSINKKISLRQDDMYLPNNNFIIETGVNVKEIEKNISKDIVTRAYVYGKNNLNIKSVNSNVEYLDNFSYTPQIIKKILINNDISDPNQLKLWGTMQLEKLCKPRFNIVVDFIDKSYFEGGSTFDTNDIVRVIDRDIDLDYTARVIYKKYDFFAPYKCSAEVGDRKTSLEDMLVKTLSNANVTENTIPSNNLISSSLIGMADSKLTLTAKMLTVENLVATKATIVELNATVANINTLIAQKATITDLNTTNANVSNLSATVANINTLVAQKADISSLNATNATISNLSATVANIDTLHSNLISTLRADVEYIAARYVEVGTLKANYATITQLNGVNAKFVNGTFSGTLSGATGEFSGNLTAGVTSCYAINCSVWASAPTVVTGTLKPFLMGSEEFTPMVITDKSGMRVKVYGYLV